MAGNEMAGWWSVKVTTAVILALLAVIVRFNWDVVRDAHLVLNPVGTNITNWNAI